MLSTIKAWLYAGALATVAIFLTMFSSTRRENELLKEVKKGQDESLRVVKIEEEVSNTIHTEHNAQEASIEASLEATKGKVKNETTSNDTLLDPEYIKLLNNSRD